MRASGCAKSEHLYICQAATNTIHRIASQAFHELRFKFIAPMPSNLQEMLCLSTRIHQTDAFHLGSPFDDQ